MIASIGGGKAAKPSEFAPWLEWASEEEEPTPFAETLEGKAMDAIINMRQKEREENG